MTATFVPTLTRAIALPDATLHVLERGPADAPPVIWLHGIMGHAREWDTATQLVAERFRVLAIEQRGHGRSSHPGDYRLERLVADVVGALDQFGLERVHLVGHSMGAIVGAAVAAHHPDRIDRLVMLDFAPDSLATPWAREELPAILGGFAEITFSDVDDATDQWLAQDPLADRALLRHYVEHCLVPDGKGRLRWAFDAARLGTFVDSLVAEDLWDLIHRVTVPTLLVHGERSHLVSPQSARRMIEALPHGSLTQIADGGHDLGVQQPVAVAHACLDFLTAV